MKELLGLEIKLITNGDITIIDSPEDHTKECFGPTYGSQSSVTGIITEVEPKVEISSEWLEKTLNGEWPFDTPIQYEVRIRIGVSYNSNIGIKTSYWILRPSHINYLLNK